MTRTFILETGIACPGETNPLVLVFCTWGTGASLADVSGHEAGPSQEEKRGTSSESPGQV